MVVTSARDIPCCPQSLPVLPKPTHLLAKVANASDFEGAARLDVLQLHVDFGTSGL